MAQTKHVWFGVNAFVVLSFVLLPAACADDTPRETIQNAIKAHGGEEKIAKTLTGTLFAKAEMLQAGIELSFSWEETFELPRRYRRAIKGQLMGKDFSMEYAITDGSGWICQNGGKPKEFEGEKPTLQGSWNAFLAILPSCLGKDALVVPGGKEKVGKRDTVGVRVSFKMNRAEAVLFFDSNSGLLVKSKKRIRHPVLRQDVDGEVIYSDYKEVSGVQYPRRIVTYVDGKKILEMEITRIELLKKIEDRLFEKP